MNLIFISILVDYSDYCFYIFFYIGVQRLHRENEQYS